MIGDIVINSYREQIKQSILKCEAVKIAGFDIIINELKRRGVKIEEVLTFFNKIKDASTKEELDRLTIDELNSIIEDINEQVTKSLISSFEIASLLIRKSNVIAKEKSPNGKIDQTDPYIKVGTNLASEINKHGIAVGLSVCVKNYCIQKLYQARYREELRKREKELGIESAIEFPSSKEKIPVIDMKKKKVMEDIFGKNIISNNHFSFTEVKIDYLESLNNRVLKLEEYK